MGVGALGVCEGWRGAFGTCSDTAGLWGLVGNSCSFFLSETVSLLCKLFFCSSKWPFLSTASWSCTGTVRGNGQMYKLLTHLSAQVLISTLECFIRAGDTKVLFCLLPQGCLQLWDVHLITTALDAAKFSPGQMAPFTFCRSSAQWDISSFMKRIMESWASQASCSVAATHSSRIFRLFSLAWRRVANSCSSADQFSSSVHLACCCRDCS